jgi:hypothetical protein
MLSVSCLFSLCLRIQPRGVITQRPARFMRRRKRGKLHHCPSGNKPSSHHPCSADFQVCVPRKHSGLVAGFQTCKLCDSQRLADLEVGDTAGLSRRAGCATSRRVWSVGGSVKVRPLRHRPNNESGETEMGERRGLNPARVIRSGARKRGRQPLFSGQSGFHGWRVKAVRRSWPQNGTVVTSRVGSGVGINPIAW